MISVYLGGFLGGVPWFLLATAVAISDVLAYRRRVATTARCIRVTDEPEGIVVHTLERVPVADEGGYAYLRSKGPSIEVGRAVTISYDPKHAHEVFLADRHPRISPRPVIGLAGIGVVQIALSIVL